MRKIYTDGACKNNPGKGGWAFVMLNESDKEVDEGFGSVKESTNQRMEMQAVISGLEKTDLKESVEIYSDSAYVVNCFNNNWMVGWKENGWKNRKNQDVKNKDLWVEMDDLVSNRSVTFIKVKGHSDNALNNKVDEMASNAAKNA